VSLSLRRLFFSFAAVGTLLVAACDPDPKDPSGPGCVMAVRMYPGCTVDPNVDSPEKLESRRQIAINRKGPNLTRALTAFCPDSATNAALAKEDACIARIDAVLPQAKADAAKRRAAAAPAVAALRADARYAPAREKFHALRIQQSVACDTDDGTACKLAHGDADAAAAVIRALLAEHQIDPRDADALGLW
jgi:hypothetical protein